MASSGLWSTKGRGLARSASESKQKWHMTMAPECCQSSSIKRRKTQDARCMAIASAIEPTYGPSADLQRPPHYRPPPSPSPHPLKDHDHLCAAQFTHARHDEHCHLGRNGPAPGGGAQLLPAPDTGPSSSSQQSSAQFHSPTPGTMNTAAQLATGSISGASTALRYQS